MSDCCTNQTTRDDPHLAIIGGGAAAFAAAIKASEFGAQVTIINEGLPIGGTCVNVGCIPSKNLIRAAEAHYRGNHYNFSGISSSPLAVDFKDVIGQKRELVQDLRQAKYFDVVKDIANIEILEGRGKLVSPRIVEINGKHIRADRILIATGASPMVPSIPGLADAGYLTNETAFDLDYLPESLIVLGGRYIALEVTQMFARFGSKVTMLQRSDRILPTESEDLTASLTGYLTQEGVTVVTNTEVRQVVRSSGMVLVKASFDGVPKDFSASEILVATGRRPNTDDMGLETIGCDLDSRGFLKVDEGLETGIRGVYGAGDVIGEPMFVYTAAYEGALAAENAILGSFNRRDYTALPWVIFTDPQVAGVGSDERQAAAKGINVDVATLPLSKVPRSLVARDTRGFIRLIRDSETDQLLGARILAPEGSELLMEVGLAIRHGITVRELASSFHPYLTLSEGIKLAALTFDKDVNKLSCCAA
ncbi:mercury(II) reductase [Thermodesulfobacteriota bacterium]